MLNQQKYSMLEVLKNFSKFSTFVHAAWLKTTFVNFAVSVQNKRDNVKVLQIASTNVYNMLTTCLHASATPPSEILFSDYINIIFI